MDLYDDVFLYDLVHGDFADPQTFDFYLKQTEISGSPVLELACGSGHILIPLAKNGVEIVGLDNSAEMISACERKASEQNIKIQILYGDMRKFELGREFKLIFIAGNSLQHLGTIDELSACFDCVKRHLAPDGKFVVEVFNPFIPLLVREQGKRYMIGEFGDHVLSEDVNYDAAAQISYINWHFWHRPSNKEKKLSFKMRQFFPQEIDLAFNCHGFVIDHKFGDFDEMKFNGNSTKQIIVAGLQ